MGVDLTFWQEYGPRLVAALAILFGGGLVALIGGGAARAYERAMTHRAEQFRTMAKKRRRAQKDAYLDSFQQLGEKASKARSLQAGALHVMTVVVVFLAARTALDFADFSVRARTALAVVSVAVAVAVMTYVLRRANRARSARLAAATDLEEKESAAP